MAGQRYAHFRLGDTAELLAEYLLGHVAFVSRVPRQEDVGHDLLCTLAEQDGKMLKAGPFFTIQVKSSYSPLVYKKRNQIRWLAQQENPFFVAVTSVCGSTVEIFSTWRVMTAFLQKGAGRVRIIPTDPPAKRNYIHRTKNNKRMDIYLGKPVISLTTETITDKKYSADRARVLKEWVLLERENITRRGAKMYWVIGYTNYETNKSLAGMQPDVSFYWNPKNLPDCLDNLNRSGIALDSVIRLGCEQNVFVEEDWKEVQRGIRDLTDSCKKAFRLAVRRQRQKGL